MNFRRFDSIAMAPCLLLCACALRHPVASLKQAVGAQPSIAVQGEVAPGANADSVVPFDIAVVLDKSTAKELAKMDAATWFGSKGRCTFMGGKKAKLQLHPWEFVPGQTFVLHVAVPADTKAIYGFAQYSATGPHRVEFSSSGAQKIQLGTDGVHVSAQKPNVPAEPTFASEKQNVCPDQ